MSSRISHFICALILFLSLPSFKAASIVIVVIVASIVVVFICFVYFHYFSSVWLVVKFIRLSADSNAATLQIS